MKGKGSTKKEFSVLQLKQVKSLTAANVSLNSERSQARDPHSESSLLPFACHLLRLLAENQPCEISATAPGAPALISAAQTHPVTRNLFFMTDYTNIHIIALYNVIRHYMDCFLAGFVVNKCTRPGGGLAGPL